MQPAPRHATRVPGSPPHATPLAFQALVNGEVGEPILIKLCSRDPEP